MEDTATEEAVAIEDATVHQVNIPIDKERNGTTTGPAKALIQT
ncbi:MAG: hypothetical protein AAF702_15935 [Chloroflexota bacterium]